jgi:hypothetical protein
MKLAGVPLVQPIRATPRRRSRVGSDRRRPCILNKKADDARPTLDAASCSGFLIVSAPTTVVRGTGLYDGAHGTITVTETFAFELPRFATGANKGQCNEGQNAQPVGEWASIVGVGSISFT